MQQHTCSGTSYHNRNSLRHVVKVPEATNVASYPGTKSAATCTIGNGNRLQHVPKTCTGKVSLQNVLAPVSSMHIVFSSVNRFHGSCNCLAFIM